MSDFTVQGASVALPSFNSSGAGDGPVAVTPRGEQLSMPWYEGWVNKGRLYALSNAAKQTALAVGGTTYSDTAPAFLIDVPTGTTMIPLHVRLRQGGTVAGGVITVLLTADVINRYSSAGTALTPRNMKIGPNGSAQRASAVSAYSGPTAAAVNTHISLQSAILAQNVGADANVNAPNTIFEWSPFNGGEPAPYLVGPASLVIYTFAGTTQPSWFYSFKWIEIDS